MGRYCPRSVARVLAALTVLGLTGTCAWASGVKLRFKPKIGEERRYKLLVSGRQEVSEHGQDGAASRSKRELRASIEYVCKALSAAEDRTRVETRLLKGAATVQFGDRTEAVDLPPYRRVTDVDCRRGVHDVREHFDVDDMPCWELPAEVMNAVSILEVACGTWTSHFEQLRLPAAEVEVGGTWADEKRPAEGTTNGSRFTLEELTTRSGHKCAKIRARWRDRFSRTGPPKGVDVPPEYGYLYVAEGQHTGEILWYYDYENSTDIHVEGSVGYEVSQPAFSSTSRSVLNFKVTLVE